MPGFHAAWIVHFRDHIAMQVSKSNKLANVCYDIRGPVLKHAKRLEEEGHRILKLNIGNPAPFGFEAPDEILQDVIRESAHCTRLQRLQGSVQRAQGGHAVLPAETGRRCRH